MKWEIDKNDDADASFLVLDGQYPISFDRLTEKDWFMHLSEKSWVDMRQILPAFIEAYDAACIPLSKQFFERHKAAFFRRAEEDYEILAQNLCSEKVHGGKLLWSLTYAFRASDACIDEILEDQYNFHPHSVISAIYDVGDVYNKHVVSRAITAVKNELQYPTNPNLSIFEYREHHWLRVPNCGRKTMDLIMASLKSLIGKRMELSNGNV
tara:strand:- start:165 stop:794 length:630 start_codon:yes stop_codon:yes gene_type:complete